MEASNITLSEIRLPANLDESVFIEVYQSCILGEQLNDQQRADFLRFAVLFLNSRDPHVKQLAYRMLLEYALSQADSAPLRDLARAWDLTPISAAIESQITPGQPSASFQTDLEHAHRSNFEVTIPGGNATLRTRGQMHLRSATAASDHALVMAPTSYGKTEILVDRVASSLGRRVVVLVPTRALISQTRHAIVNDPRLRASRTPVFTHHDSYSQFESFVAVLTQERFKRLLVKHRELAVDVLLVDEAHKLLEGNARGIELAEVIAITQRRNPNVEEFYFTPFVAEPESLRLGVGVRRRGDTISTSEQIKAERYIVARPGERQVMYDQYLDRFIEYGPSTPLGLAAAIGAIHGERLLLYVNTPRAAESAARIISAGTTKEPGLLLQQSARAIRELVHRDYGLAAAIESGVVFHHGSVPDGVRDYVEEVFRSSPRGTRRILVSTSTLLEGVNTPTDTLVLLSGSQGRANLTVSAFRNLVGRAGRLNEAFASGAPNLGLLRPRIYLVPGFFPRLNWNTETFVRQHANVAIQAATPSSNPLLTFAPRDERRSQAVDRLENLEPGTTGEKARRAPQTEVGRLCIENGISDFDVFGHEVRIQARVGLYRDKGKMNDIGKVVDGLFEVFLNGISDIDSSMMRIRDNETARSFYKMFVSWRAEGMTLREMVARNLKHWNDRPGDYVYVGDQWGELTYGGIRTAWVRMEGKPVGERVGLAVAKIKAEQDFVENRLSKYFETMSQLGLLSEHVYYTIRYGTVDSYLICLLRNGFSPELSRLIQRAYTDDVEVLPSLNSVFVYASLVERMREAEENPILVYEALTRCSEVVAAD